ncbi:hypothetical protein ABH935_009714 [Catenulispora sp. GAS73]
MASGTHAIQSSGQTRSYILRLPTGYDSSHPYRLVFGFHWVGGTMNDVDSGGTDGYNWSYYGLRRLADAAGNGTIFVAPQGNNNGCLLRLQLRRFDDLRLGLRPAGGLPRGRRLPRCEPEWLRRRHAAGGVHRPERYSAISGWTVRWTLMN